METRDGREPIAVIGFSLRAPHAENAKELWKLMFDGEDAVGPVPPSRWVDHRATQAGFLTESIDKWDADFFGFGSYAASCLDPQIRLLLEVCWEALEDAGVHPDTIRNTRTGVYTAVWQQGYQSLVERSPENTFLKNYMGNSVGAGAAQLAFFLGANGPCMSNESGCASSLVSLHQAVSGLRLGDCKLAVCGAVNLIIRPFDFFTMEHVLSKTGKCKTFDKEADGFARAEGCGVMVLKTFTNALQDGDPIHALILGTGLSYNGESRSMGTPTVRGEALAITRALSDAAVSPQDVVYVETHGTATKMGDAVELKSIYDCYCSKPRQQKLIVGSIKTNIGHSESASGILGLLKSILVLQKGCIPRHLHFRQWNPSVGPEIGTNLKVPLENMALPNQDKARLVAVSSFGIAGVNGHVVLQEAMKQLSAPRDTSPRRPLSILKITAKTKAALDALTLRWLDYLQDIKLTNKMEDIFYTGNTGRNDWPWRQTVLAKDLPDAATQLRRGHGMIAYIPDSKAEGLLCFLFSGQGSQFSQMSQYLYESSPVYRAAIDECLEILEKQYDVFLYTVLWEPNCELIHHTLYSQTAIFCIEYALWKLWTSFGIRANVLLGHSAGEFAAAVAANVLTMPEALKILVKRCRLIELLPHGIMLAVGTDEAQVKKLLMEAGADLDIAAINGYTQVVVAGTEKEVSKLEILLSNINIKWTRLKATHAFHSRMMDPVLPKLETTLKNIEWNTPEVNLQPIVYVSSLEGKPLGLDRVAAPEYWLRHTRQPVQFQNACLALAKLGVTSCVEVGPNPVLSTLVALNLEKPPNVYPSLQRGRADWEVFLGSFCHLYLKGYPVDWIGYEEGRKRLKVAGLPTYTFQKKKYWIREENGNNSCSHLENPFLGTYMCGLDNAYYFNHPQICHEKLPYLADHKIGDSILFPASAMIETCFAAGFQVATLKQFPRFAITLLDFEISAPLLLPKPVQTLVSKSSENYKVRLASRGEVETTHVWIPHADASIIFTTYQTIEKLKEKLDTIPTILRKLSAKEPAFFYSDLRNQGYNFGPEFRRIISLRQPSETDVVAEVMSPASRYHHLHPVVLDAAFQATILLLTKSPTEGKIYLPTSIQSVTLHFSLPEGWAAQDQTVYVRVWKEHGICRGILTSAKGDLIADFNNLGFREATIPQIESVLKEQESVTPQALHHVWEVLIDNPDNTLNLQNINFLGDWKTEGPEDNLSESEKITQQQMEHLAELFIVEFLEKIDYSSDMTIHQFMVENKFLPKFRRLLQFFRTVRDKMQTTLQKPDELVTSLEMSGMQKLLPMFLYIKHNLNDILMGNQDVLSLLFPLEECDNKTTLSADIYYKNHPGISRILDEMIFQIEKLINIARRCRKTAQKIRILEIGSGTCMLTAMILPLLRKFLKSDFELWVTDVTDAFLRSAETRFMEFAPCVQYALFNMDVDPMSQGIPTDYFDVVLAFEVLHISVDPSITLHNIWATLKTGGVLCFGESIIQSRETTFIFGLLPGYWRFKDADRVNRNHCCLPIKSWHMLLENQGFTQMHSSTAYNKRFGCVLCAKTSNSRIKMTRKILQPKWLILLEKDDEIMHRVVLKLSTTSPVLVICRNMSTYGAGNWHDLQENHNVTLQHGNFVEALDQHMKSLAGIFYAWISKEPKNTVDDSVQFAAMAKRLLKWKGKLPCVYVVTPGTYAISEQESVVAPNAGILSGLTRSLMNEIPALKARLLDVSYEIRSEKESKLIVRQLLQQVCRTQQHYDHSRTNNYLLVALRGHAGVSTAKLTKVNLKGSHSECPIPIGTNKYYLGIPDSEKLSDYSLLALGLEPQLMEDHMVEVRIYSYGLNFRDVLRSLLFIKTESTMQFHKFVCEFAGIVTQCGKQVTNVSVGDRVCGLGFQPRQLPSYVTIDSELALRIPNQITFSEAVTFPAAFATTYESLIKSAKLREGETLLIHAASGAVGLTMIQIAKTIQAKIIATAGTQRKRNYLKNTVGIKHVFESRNTSFSTEVIRVTEGKGVDVLLNCLTGEGLVEASLNCCARKARFVEIGKHNIWTSEQVHAVRSDIAYFVVDLLQANKQNWVEYNQQLLRHILMNSLRPLPYVSFDVTRIKHAMEYFKNANHIGKVVVTLPTSNNCNNEGPPQLFNAESAYLITGGLGGIGFSLCSWMLERGAKHVYLMSRNPPEAEAIRRIAKINSSGGKIIVVNGDVSRLEDCENVKKAIQVGEHGPLKGIMHCAGVVHDASYAKTDRYHFEAAYCPKLFGTWNLHRITENMNLEFFVLHSSASALFGIRGQPNHSAANSFLDAFAHWRRSQGLPATSINWGQWSEVGSATNVHIGGVQPTSNRRMLQGLEHVMRSNITQILLGDLQPYCQLVTYMPIAKYIMDKTFLDDTSKVISPRSPLTLPMNAPTLYTRLQSCKSKTDKIKTVTEFLKERVSVVLRMGSQETVSTSLTLALMGMDSYMVREFVSLVQAKLGKEICFDANQLQGSSTINQLTKIIISSNDFVRLKEAESKKCKESSMYRLLLSDVKLPDTVKEMASKAKVATSPESVQTVLITGATGFLGKCFMHMILSESCTKITKIYCLCRHPVNPVEFGSSISKVIVVVEGDITKPNLGIEKEIYKRLCEDVQAVFHFAVKANHVENYDTRVPGSLRSTNVVGTHHLLEFCATRKLKRVFYSSSICAPGKLEKGNQWPNEDALHWAADNAAPGYVTSKLISELCFKLASTLGIPSRCVRFPLIGGYISNGKLPWKNNHLVLRLLTYLELGVILQPEFNLPLDIIPVDTCAAIAMKCFLMADLKDGVYCIHHPAPKPEADFKILANAEFGMTLNPVSDKEFQKMLLSRKTPLAPFIKFYEDISKFQSSIATFGRTAQQSSVFENDLKGLPCPLNLIKDSLHYVISEKSSLEKQNF